MGLPVESPVILRLLKLSAICTLLTVHGSTGSGLFAPLSAPPLMSAPSSRTKRFVPSLSPSTPMEATPHDAAPPPYQGDSPSLSPRFAFISPSNPTATPPSTIHADAPSLLPGAPREKTLAGNASISVPVATPTNFPQIAPAISPSKPGTFPPTAHQTNRSKSEAPVEEPIAPGTLAPSPSAQKRNESNNKAPGAPVATPPGPTIHPSIPATLPPTSHQRNESNYEAPMVAPVAPAPPTGGDSLPIHHQRNASDDKAPAISPSPGIQERNESNNKAPGAPVATPPGPTIHPSIPAALPPTSHRRNESNYEAPMVAPVAPAPPTRGDSPPSHHQRNASDDKAPAISPSPGIQERNESNNKAPGAPVATPPGPTIHPSIPTTLPPTSHQRNESNYEAPMVAPVAPAPPTRGDSPPIYHQRNASDDKAPAISPSPGIQERNESNNKAPGAPVATPPGPTIHPSIPATLPPTSHQRNENYEAPMVAPVAPAPPTRGDSPPSHHQKNASNDKAPAISPSPSIQERNESNNMAQGPPVATPPGPTIHPSIPATLPPTSHRRNESNYEAPMVAPVAPASPTRGDSPPIHHQRNASDDKAPAISPTTSNPDVSPVSTPSVDWEKGGVPVAAPPNDIPKLLPPVNHSPTQAVAPSKHNAMRHSDDALSPSLVSPRPPQDRGQLSPSLSPLTSFHKPHLARNRMSSPSPAYVIRLPPNQQGPAKPPAFIPSSGRRQNAPALAPFDPGSLFSPSRHPFPPSMSHASPAPSPIPSSASGWTKMPILSPKVSPPGPSPTSSKVPFLPPIQALPPPPPNEDCSSTVCTEPYTNTPSGSPCGCVWPMQVGLRLSVALYTFFPLVSQLAEEIATGVFMKQSQVRIIGANAASQQTEKTIVLIDLVPLEETFDNTTAFLTYQRFWHKRVAINPSLFGEYDVLYVRYPGLPPSPPSAPSINMIDGGPYSANGNNARAIKPLGVDLPNRQHNDGLSGGIIAVIVLSVLVAVVLSSALAWVLLFKHRDRALQAGSTQQSLPTTVLKPSGTTGSIIGSGISSTSLSFGSSIAPYTGSAKTFSTADIEKATDNFNPLRVLGEGGFGRVYSGVLEDGTKVAVKVLKREDQQGGREFLAEVEMLSRLHHRNLVKLIGICTEEHNRCLVYELIPNGSVESHLHGVDNEAASLNWDARVKIALGAARGLAYLHEDSSPRVIHRDFKSSNILLEHDFTPKVSDFGLARAAMDEENRHISTRVMGTFGYVAPEYAMTGHLLVKSDVYSYGVVLLELLTGRKPVEMSQPPGQENLVAWARPLLTSREGLETIVDPSLGPDVPFDSIAKVAAIASMCVQPEVSHRPFMGEVVQALKLVCNECDEAKEVGSRTSSRENLSIDLDAGVGIGSRQLPDPLQSQYHMPHYDFGPDREMGLSASDLFNASVRLDRQASGSFRRYSSSGPLRTGRGRQFWQTIRGLTGGSVSEHGVTFKVQPGSH